MRLAFTPTERVAIAAALKEVQGERRGRPKADPEKPGDCPEFPAGTETRELIAKKAGFSSATQYERAKAVVDHGAPNVVEAMNAGDLSISATPGGCFISGRSWAANRVPSRYLPPAKFDAGFAAG